ncbi:Asp23/Gls24 family envelope stress response protein [Pseudonocardia sp. ICBG1293]|uniref:Asp23/Gls24 family envelope stress response protein n=1 Tax=Pseudonocardia sp. ICBG1293 TaxID=2844382 RepID=UPI001CCBFD6E|nr:Asp23/Gls24 family envelope stress response protein [Pseudonocardia sp. ICBG1293]
MNTAGPTGTATGDPDTIRATRAAPPPPDDTPTRTIDTGTGPGAAGTAAEDRGRVDVADQVVQKIALGALEETEGVGGTAGTVGRMLGRADSAGHPRVEATVSGRSTRIDARISVAYPSPVAAVCDRARAHVVRQVEALTGLSVARVDVVVTALTVPGAARQTGRELE